MEKIDKKKESLSHKKACDPNLSFVVEACAGSGKTWLICSRILRFLVEGGRPSSVLALTFTNKAASEMHNRLNQFLYFLATRPYEKVIEKLLSIGINESQIDDVYPRARSLYESILVEADQPNICTFHSWYCKILLMSPVRLGVYSHISLSSSSKEFQQQVWQKFLDTQKKTHNSEDSEFMLLVENIGLRAIKISLCSLISIRIEVESVLKNLNFTTQDHSLKESIELCETKKIIWCKKKSNEALFLFHHFKLLEDRNEFSRLLKDLNPKNLLKISDYILRKDKSSLAYQFIRKKDEGIWKEKSEEVKHRTQEFARSLILLFRDCQILIHQARDSVLIKLSKTFFLCLDKYVFEKKETDYAGLEYLAWKNISGEHGSYIHNRLDFKYDQILIDEFQDTSSCQWKILKNWLEEYITSEFGVDSTSPKIFIVGDPKQSIYRFRGADPRVFHKASEWLKKNFHAQKFRTNKTRRCAEKIVKFMNSLFQNKDSFFYEKHYSLNKIQGNVFLLPIIKNNVDAIRKNLDRNWLVDPLGGKDSELWKIEGEQIAKLLLKIKTSLDDFAWDDVKILVRSRIHSQDISESLSKFGIPNVLDSNLNLLDQQEIIDLVALMRFLLEDKSDYSFVAVAKSTLFAIQDEELVWLKNISDVMDSKNTLWKNLNNLVKDNKKTVPKKFLNFVKSMILYSEKLEFMPVQDFLQYIVSSSPMVENLEASLDLHRFKNAISNIEKFIEFALDVDFGKFPSLAKFLTQLRHAKKYRDIESLNVDHIDEFEAISIQTLHSAKGLEARVVVLAGMGDLENYDKDGIKWLYSLDQNLEKIVSMSTYKSGDFLDENQEKILQHEKKLLEEEKLNLLYVGVTRAKEILIMSAVEQKKQKNSWYDLVASNSNECHVLNR